ncbi:uncharacterized protein JCM15063_006357 [Sporobolomyces koalae]|uniref:uncharacterized protein n=1 Tax=Sporobolomyces koalae TaxID=500713 RepID=UPI003179B877
MILPPPAHTPNAASVKGRTGSPVVTTAAVSSSAISTAADSAPSLPSSLVPQVDSIERILGDLESYQIPQLADCQGPRATYDHLVGSVRQELSRVRRDLDELKLDIEDLDRAKDRQRAFYHLEQLQLWLDQCTKQYRSAVVHAKRTVDNQQHLFNRDELLSAPPNASSGRQSPSPASNANGQGDDALMSATSDVTEGLRRTLQLLQSEVDRSIVSNEQLEQQTSTMASASNQYSTLSTLLSNSKTLITSLERADVLDRFVLFVAFAFFVAVCSYIFKKRVVDRGLQVATTLTGFVGSRSGSGTNELGAVGRAFATASAVVAGALKRVNGAGAIEPRSVEPETQEDKFVNNLGEENTIPTTVPVREQPDHAEEEERFSDKPPPAVTSELSEPPIAEEPTTTDEDTETTAAAAPLEPTTVVQDQHLEEIYMPEPTAVHAPVHEEQEPSEAEEAPLPEPVATEADAAPSTAPASTFDEPIDPSPLPDFEEDDDMVIVNPRQEHAPTPAHTLEQLEHDIFADSPSDDSVDEQEPVHEAERAVVPEDVEQEQDDEEHAFSPSVDAEEPVEQDEGDLVQPTETATEESLDTPTPPSAETLPPPSNTSPEPELEVDLDELVDLSTVPESQESQHVTTPLDPETLDPESVPQLDVEETGAVPLVPVEELAAQLPDTSSQVGAPDSEEREDEEREERLLQEMMERQMGDPRHIVANSTVIEEPISIDQEDFLEDVPIVESQEAEEDEVEKVEESPTTVDVDDDEEDEEIPHEVEEQSSTPEAEAVPEPTNEPQESSDPTPATAPSILDQPIEDPVVPEVSETPAPGGSVEDEVQDDLLEPPPELDLDSNLDDSITEPSTVFIEERKEADVAQEEEEPVVTLPIDTMPAQTHHEPSEPELEPIVEDEIHEQPNPVVDAAAPVPAPAHEPVLDSPIMDVQRGSAVAEPDEVESLGLEDEELPEEIPLPREEPVPSPLDEVPIAEPIPTPTPTPTPTPPPESTPSPLASEPIRTDQHQVLDDDDLTNSDVSFPPADVDELDTVEEGEVEEPVLFEELSLEPEEEKEEQVPLEAETAQVPLDMEEDIIVPAHATHIEL